MAPDGGPGGGISPIGGIMGGGGTGTILRDWMKRERTTGVGGFE